MDSLDCAKHYVVLQRFRCSCQIQKFITLSVVVHLAQNGGIHLSVTNSKNRLHSIYYDLISFSPAFAFITALLSWLARSLVGVGGQIHWFCMHIQQNIWHHFLTIMLRRLTWYMLYIFKPLTLLHIKLGNYVRTVDAKMLPGKKT